jgi:hypothetical protein
VAEAVMTGISQYANVPMGCPEAGSELLPGKRKPLRGYFFWPRKHTKGHERNTERQATETCKNISCDLVCFSGHPLLPQAEEQKKAGVFI